MIVAIDNLDLVSDQIADVIDFGRLSRVLIVGAERENGWHKRTKHKLGSYSIAPIIVREFSEADAIRILAKLEQYGSWTRLGQMSAEKRVRELIDRARKQLLIALLEATFGRGFEEIIESDYAALTTDEERLFLLVVGLVTDKGCEAPATLVDNALNALSIHLAGIVISHKERLVVRHPVYMRYLLERVVDPSLTAKALSGLLHAFALYEAPVIQHVSKLEATIYKSLINHGFLFDVLKGRRNLIIHLYESLEKRFERDGLFWLQYGLALRDLNLQEEALEKLRIARQAYPMEHTEHTEHALAQQLLILGGRMDDREKAMSYLEEACEMLQRLDHLIESDDTYPIVTLAEGHTKVLRRHIGEKEAQTVAANYAKALKERSDKEPDHARLRASYETMFRYATTGTWTEKTN